MKKGELITPLEAQNLALKEALRGVGFVSPNPLVGCVIVDKEHRFLSSGFHARLGGDHAEIDALKKISREELQGAIVYVTLEPCSHQGRTGSCAERLIAEPIAKVVAALKDPNPLVSGKGFEILKQKGIEVEINSEFGLKAKRVCEEFFWNMTTKLPFIALKVGSSLDGQMALKNGESRWVTSDESRLQARRLRARYDATLIGARTLIKDDPLLNFRDTEFEGQKTNRVVVWDPKGVTEKFLPKSRLLTEIPKENVIVLKSLEIKEAELKDLYDKGIHSLFVEGGAYAHSEFLKRGHFQKIYCFMSPSILGGGLGWTSHVQLQSMAQKIPLVFEGTEKVGEDLLLTLYPGLQ